MKNESGYHPIDDRVLIKTIPIEKKTAGGIMLPDTTKDAEDMAQIHGHLVAGGADAIERLAKQGIQPGQMVVFAKYSGLPFTGLDEQAYRIMNAKDVIGWSEGYFDKNFRARTPMRAIGD
jgi:chaperonin GroES